MGDASVPVISQGVVSHSYRRTGSRARDVTVASGGPLRPGEHARWIGADLHEVAATTGLAGELLIAHASRRRRGDRRTRRSSAGNVSLFFVPGVLRRRSFLRTRRPVAGQHRPAAVRCAFCPVGRAFGRAIPAMARGPAQKMANALSESVREHFRNHWNGNHFCRFSCELGVAGELLTVTSIASFHGGNSETSRGGHVHGEASRCAARRRLVSLRCADHRVLIRLDGVLPGDRNR